MSHTAQRLVFVFLAVLVWVVVITKAVTQPFVHDEARCYYLYVQTGEFLPYHSHWDAGNHVLSSFAAWIFTSVLGVSHLSLRLFSILCFPLYAAYGWRWAARWQGQMVRWPFLLAWVGTPFLLEFFALFRGYGPGLAFMAMGLYHGARWMERSAPRDLLFTLVAFNLAVWCNLGLVTILAMVVGQLSLSLWLRRSIVDPRYWITWCFLGLFPLVLALVYGKALSDRGLLYYGATNGLVDGTLASLLHFTLDLDLASVRVLVIGLTVGMTLVGAWVWRGEGTQDATVFIVGVLILELLARWLMWQLFGTPLPVDRTAVHFVVLFLIAFALCSDGSRIPVMHRLSWIGLLLLAFPIMAFTNFSRDSSSLWPEQQVETALVGHLAALDAQDTAVAMVGGDQFLQQVVQLEAQALGVVAPLLDDSRPLDPVQDHLLLDTLRETAPIGHRIIHRSVNNALVLTAREMPCTISPRHASEPASIAASTDEFRELYRGGVFDLAGSPIRLDLGAQIHTSSPAMVVDLVVEQFDAKGHKIADQRIALRTLWRSDRNGHIHLARLLPAQVDGSLLIFLYNPERITYTMDHLELTLSTVHCE